MTGPFRHAAFAADPLTSAYYEQRAREYDDWYLGRGLFARRDRPGWREELDAVIGLIESLEPARTLDVACGTGFLTRHLRGFVVGVDQSESMVQIAQQRLPTGLALVGDGLSLPFAPAAFERVLTAHFYGHLPASERVRFLAEVRRVAGELIVIDSAPRPDRAPEQWEDRVLSNGSHHRIFKRYVSGEDLARELGGEALLEGRWFAAARARFS